VIQRAVEEAGVSTVSISLVREFTEQVRPPRALWVPFPFGRPLGAPADAVVQHKVLRTALSLLERDRGPVLDEFVLDPEDEELDARYQAIGRQCGPRGCSIDDLDDLDDGSGAPPGTDVEEIPYDGDFGHVVDEIAGLKADHASYRARRNGRTAVGSSGVTPEGIVAAAEAIHRFVDGEAEMPRSADAPAAARDINVFVRLCIDDVKAFYMESWVEANGGKRFGASEANDWLWLETWAGRMIIAARDRLVAITDTARDPNWIVARAIVPRGYGSSGYTLGHVTRDTMNKEDR
jgi:hypothetical protein